MNTLSFDKLAIERQHAFEVEASMKLPQVQALNDKDIVNLRVEHNFSFGVYARHLYIPAGAICVGKIHKHQNLNYLLKGKLRIWMNGKIVTIEAPYCVISPPGTKRIVKAVEDCLWATIHGTHETDVDEIEKIFLAGTEEEYLEHIQANQLKLELDSQ